MQVKVIISATLRMFVNKQAEVTLDGNTVSEVIENLVNEYPEIKKGLFDEGNNLRDYVGVFLNETDVSDRNEWYTSLKKNDELFFLPSIAGGMPSSSIIPEERRKAVSLDDEEIDRFSKHLMLREIGVKGQKNIKAAKVLVIGLGALGSPVVQYLAGAGVGTLGIADFDEVSVSNLQSQPLHTKRDIHRPKTASARDRIKNINPKIQIEVITEKIEASNIAETIDPYDVVVDCTDNYKARYLINDACVLRGKPLVFGAIYQFEGRVSVLNYDNGPCYRCLYPSPPPAGLFPTCSESGVIGPLPGIVGSRQAVEVLKLLLGSGEVLSGKLQVMDIWNNRDRLLKVQRKNRCPICGINPSINNIQDFDYEDFCGLKPKEDEIPVEGIEIEALLARLDRNEPITLIDVREPHERAIHKFPDAKAIPIGQLARRLNELNPEIDTVFICREGKRSILAINTLREAGYTGPMYNLIGGIESAKDIIFSHEGAWL